MWLNHIKILHRAHRQLFVHIAKITNSLRFLQFAHVNAQCYTIVGSNEFISRQSRYGFNNSSADDTSVSALHWREYSIGFAGGTYSHSGIFCHHISSPKTLWGAFFAALAPSLFTSSSSRVRHTPNSSIGLMIPDTFTFH